MQSCLVGLDDDTGDDERCAAEFKEVVGSTHLVHLQDLCEDIAERLLRIVGRSHEGRSNGKLWLRQCLHVGLAIRRHRHLCQLQISRGHHILRQALGDLSLQGIGRNLMIGRVVGTEVFLVIQLANHEAQRCSLSFNLRIMITTFFMPSTESITFSISPSSIRRPRSLIWWSVRPRITTLPSGSHFA